MFEPGVQDALVSEIASNCLDFFPRIHHFLGHFQDPINIELVTIKKLFGNIFAGSVTNAVLTQQAQGELEFFALNLWWLRR